MLRTSISTLFMFFSLKMCIRDSPYGNRSLDKLYAAINSEKSTVQTEIVSGSLAPFFTGIIVIVTGSLLICFQNPLFRLGICQIVFLGDTANTAGKIRMDKYRKHVGEVSQSIIDGYKRQEVDFNPTASQISRTAGGNPRETISCLIYSRISLCFLLIFPCSMGVPPKLNLFFY